LINYKNKRNLKRKHLAWSMERIAESKEQIAEGIED
jgi:hypothetical protein